MTKIDERDTMFARASYRKDSKSYIDYYKRNPHLKDVDDAVRAMPNLCSLGTKTYDKISSPIADAAFGFLGDIRKYSNNAPNPTKVDVDPELITKRIKGLAKYYGASLVGVTRSLDYHYYSHRGRHEDVYGEIIENKYNYSIAFAVRMNRDMILRSPLLPEVIETSRAYVEVGIIGMIISYYIQSLGYEAFNNMDANYLVDTVSVAKDAGLGEIGRNNMLTNKDYGSFLRLGIVNTTIPMIEDVEISFGLNDFCKHCGKCAANCLSKSINRGIDGPWKTNPENCYKKWRELGTDCGVCIASCPFGQGLESIENINTFSGDISSIKKVIAEYDEKFGKRPIIKEVPDWLE